MTPQCWPQSMVGISASGPSLITGATRNREMLIASGVDVISVSRRLGHSSPKVTLEVYGHLIDGGDERAAQIVGAVFGNGSISVAEGAGRPGN